MNTLNQCRETFLSGITDVYLYPTSGSSLPVPSCVAQILNLENCAFVSSVLHVSLEGTGTGDCISDNITAKVTPSLTAGGTIYTIEVSANIEDGSNNVREVYKTMEGNDYYIVLKLQDDTYLLGYTLPNTFLIKPSRTINNTAEQRQLTVSAKSLSEFFPITFHK